MESLHKLNEAVKNIIEIANGINDETNKAIFDNAPIVIHQRLCAELVSVCMEEPNKTPMEIPKATKILSAIKLLEELYPKYIKP